jgi:hypothetical protein
MATRSTLLVLVLVLVAAGGWFLWQRGQDAPVPAPQVPNPPSSRQAMTSVPAPVKSPERPQEMVRYPDGGYMPPLNGVTIPANLAWPPDHPFSPIVGKQATPDGTEWYIHADGTCSTTVMVWRSDVGRKVPYTHVARPVPVAPVDNR